MLGALMAVLQQLVDTANRAGWAIGSITTAALRSQAASLGWEQVATRTGDHPVATLRPTTPEQAHPHSLSALHGLGEQPLHTDGAHLPDPPHYVVLHAARPNETPTLLLSRRVTSPDGMRVLLGTRPEGEPAAVLSGIFVVRDSSTRFLTTAYTHRDGYRYDPGCMSPADQRAHDVAAYFTTQACQAHRHQWSGADQVLLIDNRWTLHARAAVADEDRERELTRIAYRTQVAS